MVQTSKLCPTVRTVTERKGGNLYCPHNVDSNMSSPVIDVLHQNYPEPCISVAANIDDYGTPLQSTALRKTLQSRLPSFTMLLALVVLMLKPAKHGLLATRLAQNTSGLNWQNRQ